jgi:hypothetical protein
MRDVCGLEAKLEATGQSFDAVAAARAVSEIEDAA